MRSIVEWRACRVFSARKRVIPKTSRKSGSVFRACLAELPAGDDPNAPLFPEACRIATANNNVSELSRQFHEVLRSANMIKGGAATHKGTGKGRDVARERNRLSFHSLRHTATLLLKAAGVSEAVARDIIGHESAEISRHYTHVDEDSKRKAIALLPDLTGRARARH